MTSNIVTLQDFPKKTERFPCSPGMSWMRTIAISAGIVMEALLCSSGVAMLISLLRYIAASGVDQYATERLSTLFFVTVFFPLELFVGVTAFVLAYSDIAIGKEGVWLHLVASRYLFVPRQSFAEMKISKAGYSGTKRHLKPWGAFAIQVPGLTFFHRLVSIFHWVGLRPSFLVTPDHDRYEILLEKLKEMHDLPPE